MGLSIVLLLAIALVASASVEASACLSLLSLVSLWIVWRNLSHANSETRVSVIGLCVGGLAVWLAITDLWANPSYSSVPLYHAAFLFGGWLLGRRAGHEGARLMLTVFLVAVLVAALWALWQVIGEGGARPHALFKTPATLTSVINLALLPCLVLLVGGLRRPVFLAALVCLLSAFFAASSRGGWLAFAGALLFVFLLMRRAGMRIDRRTQAILISLLVAGWAIANIMSMIGAIIGTPTSALPLEEGGLSLLARLGMYALALHALSLHALLTGQGYFAFYYLMQANAGSVPGYEKAVTYFVHNDYLQSLLELGVPGLIGFTAIAALPLVAIWRATLQPTTPPVRKAIIALGAAIASMAIHGFVDFPFYVPICVLIYGTALGSLEAILLRERAIGMVGQFPARLGNLRRIAIAAVATWFAWLLSVPVAAEASARYAQRQWARSKDESAAYWFELARRLEPRDWRYHWQAGQFWFVQAARGANPEAARLADRAYAAGFAANPREASNLIGRISLQRQLGEMLGSGADPHTLRAWAERAVELAPQDPRSRREFDRVLKEFGKPAEGPAK